MVIFDDVPSKNIVLWDVILSFEEKDVFFCQILQSPNRTNPVVKWTVLLEAMFSLLRLHHNQKG